MPKPRARTCIHTVAILGSHSTTSTAVITTLCVVRDYAGFRLYDFRHTFGSRSAMAGVDLATLKELMGHTSISTTLRYVHPTPEHKRQAMEKLERFNIDQVFAQLGHAESLQKSLQ